MVFSEQKLLTKTTTYVPFKDIPLPKLHFFPGYILILYIQWYSVNYYFEVKLCRWRLGECNSETDRSNVNFLHIIGGTSCHNYPTFLARSV